MPTKKSTRALSLPLLVAIATSGCQLSADLLHMPRYIHDYFTNPNFVVNAPVVHEILGRAKGTPDSDTMRARFRLPPGFTMNVYASDIALARFMRPTPAGDIIISQPAKQRVLLLARDANNDGRADEVRVLLDDLHFPHGVELVGETLYVATPYTILRVGFDIETGSVIGEPEVFAELPEIMGHSNRPLRLGPDGYLYSAIGSSCNQCEPGSDREQTVIRFDIETGHEEIVASGFRNVAHFDWRPDVGTMYATEVGADYLGDDLPMEEINEIIPGGFYGFPYLHGPDYRDPKLAADHQDRIAESVAPAHTFTAHSTPLGIHFLRNDALPSDYRGAALVALKGSWNRHRKSGYKVVSLHWTEGVDGAQIEEREFLTGFERDEHVIGRPVDIVEAPSGELFLSDDMAGAVYRIRFDPGGIPIGDDNVFGLDLPVQPGRGLAKSDRQIDDNERAALRDEGESLYARHACAECHEATAARPNVKSLDRLRERFSTEDLVDVLGAPPAAMPRFLLRDEERLALAVYLLDAQTGESDSN